MNRSKNQKYNKKGARKRIGGKKKFLPNIPFPLLATPALGHTFQFTALSVATETAITRQALLDLILTATSAVLGYPIIGAIKIKKIRIWSPIVSTFVPETVQIEWNGGFYAPSAIHSAISEGLFPAKLETVPPPLSSPDLWSLAGASNLAEALFSVSAPQNSIIQLSVAIRLMDDEPQGTPVVLVGATAGKVYYSYLDGAANGIFQPSGGVSVAP